MIQASTNEDYEMNMELREDIKTGHWALYVNGKRECTFATLSAAMHLVPEAEVTT